MATITGSQARYIGNTRGGCRIPFGGPGVKGFKEAASQTYDAGAIVNIDSTSGKLESKDNADDLAALFGQAMKDATGTTDEPVYGFVFAPGDLLIMNLEDNGSGKATALADLRKPVTFNLVSGNLVADVDTPVYTKPYGVIRDIYCTEHGYLDGDALGDTNGRVIVEIQGGDGLGNQAAS